MGEEQVHRDAGGAGRVDLEGGDRPHPVAALFGGRHPPAAEPDERDHEVARLDEVPARPDGGLGDRPEVLHHDGDEPLGDGRVPDGLAVPPQVG